VSAKKTDSLIKNPQFRCPVLDRGNRSVYFPPARAKVSVTALASAAIAQPRPTASDWLGMLDNQSPYSDGALGDKPFVDFAGYLSAQQSNDPAKLFSALYDTALKISKARNTVDSIISAAAK
jgi:hypothetical protein